MPLVDYYPYKLQMIYMKQCCYRFPCPVWIQVNTLHDLPTRMQAEIPNSCSCLILIENICL
jgi:hypothetical protein